MIPQIKDDINSSKWFIEIFCGFFLLIFHSNKQCEFDNFSHACLTFEKLAKHMKLLLTDFKNTLSHSDCYSQNNITY